MFFPNPNIYLRYMKCMYYCITVLWMVGAVNIYLLPFLNILASAKAYLEPMHNELFLGFTHTPASYTSMASNIRNLPITPGLL